MKKFLLPLLLLTATFAPTIQTKAQTITRAMFQVDDAGNKLAGVIITPNDFFATTDSTILFIFSHGKGESGSGTVSTLGDPVNGGGVFANGSPLTVAGAAAGPFSAVSPTTGKTLRFVMFGLQGIGNQTWCATAAQNDYAVKNLIKTYRVKTVIPTGLSAGGEVTWEMLAGPNAKLYAGAIPMSTPGTWGTDFTGPAANYTKVWSFHGAQDGGLTDPVNTTNNIKALDAVRKGLTRLTLYPGTHCCWNVYYAPSYRENVTYYYNGNKYTKAMNIYEFAAACASGATFVFDTTATPLPGPVVTTTTQAVENISISGNTVTLDASKSTNALSYDWYVTVTGTGAYFNLSAQGLHPDQKIVVIPNVPVGTYNVRLTIQDGGGTRSQALTSVTVGAIAGPAIVQTFPGNDGKIYTLYNDGTWKAN